MCVKTINSGGASTCVRGFTLIELIMVIVILGILSVYATSQVTSSATVNANGLHSNAMSYLRYAQKAAIAQRRTVCVSFPSSTTLQLQIASAAPELAAGLTCDTALTGPRGESPALLSAGSGTSFGSTPSVLWFDALGQPIDATGTILSGTQTIKIAGMADIQVEAWTGYVHE